MSNHQKRLSAPKNYPIRRKEGTYVVKPEGPHPEAEGLPLVVVLRDVLEYAESEREVKNVLSQGNVLVNGRSRKSPAYTVGFMDVISFPEMDEHYRILFDVNGFVMQQVDDADQTLVRVADKTTLNGGVTQLNFHNGSNVETEDEYTTKSSLLVTLPDMDIEKEISFEEGNTAYIRGGKHAGTVATITDIIERAGTHPRTVMLETEDGETVETTEKNVYMLGEDGAEVDVNGE